MVETVFAALIWIGIVIIVALVVLWALRSFGPPLPEQAIKVAWVVVALIILLILWRAFGGYLPSI